MEWWRLSSFFGGGFLLGGFFGGRGFVGDAEVDLAFEAVDAFGDDGDFLAHFVTGLGPAADEGVAGRGDAVEIVAEGGDVDEAEGLGIEKFDEHAVVADFGDDGGEAGAVFFRQFAFEEFEELEFDVFAFGFGAVLLGGGEVVAEVIELGLGVVTGFLRERFGVGELVEIGFEKPVDDEVGIAADRGGEVGVVFLVEAVVAFGGGHVAGALEASQELDAKGVALRVFLDLLENFFDFVPVAEISGHDAVGGEEFAVFVEFVFGRFFVDAEDRGDFVAGEFRGHGFVGEEHVFLDELVAFVVFDDFDSVGVALFVDEDFGFGDVEIEAAGIHAALPDFGGDGPELADAGLEIAEFGVGKGVEGAAGGAGLVGGGEGDFADFFEVVFFEEGERLFVGEAFVAADDAVGEGGFEEFSLGGEDEENGFREAVFVFDEAAEAVGKLFRQHRDDGADEVGGVSAAAGFLVEFGFGLYVGADIGDVDADLDFAVGEVFDGKGVVEVFGVVGIDGEGENVAQVFAAFEFAFADLGGDFGEFFFEGFREFLIEMEFAENAFEFGTGFVGFAEDFDDVAFGVDVALGPFVEADDDFVVDLGNGLDAGAGGVADVDILNDSRVVGDNVVGEAAFLEGADDFGAGAFEDADDAPVGRLISVAAAGGVAGRIFEADDDAVVMHGDAGVFGVDFDGRELAFSVRRFGDEEGGTALFEDDFAADEVGVARNDEAVFFDADDGAFLKKILDGFIEFGAFVFFAAEATDEFVLLQGDVIPFAHQLENAVAKIHGHLFVFAWRWPGNMIIFHENCPCGKRVVSVY